MTTHIPAEKHGYVLGPEDGRRLASLGLRILAGEAEVDGLLMAGVVTNQGPGGPPLHTHFAMDELYLVLEGRYRFKVGDNKEEGGPGTFVFVPRGESHSFASLGPEEGRLFVLTLPSSEDFLRGIVELSERGLDQREMVEHFRAFHSGIDGPPLLG